jgi:uncharacterized SAM-binding protein YcdF (DUF218 family)
VFVIGLAAAAFLLFAIGVVREPRSFGNAVFLGLALAFGALAVVRQLAVEPDRPHRLLLDLILLVTVLGPFLIAGFLVVNGITMARRERLRPANLLPLAAGIAMFAVIGLTIAAVRAGSFQVTLATGVTDLVFGYVSFLLVSYVIYTFVYGRLPALSSGGDFVVVLGAGLKRDGTPTPLLAKRLDKAREVAGALAARGGPAPPIVVSGGKGDDERLAEAEAMKIYLTDRGVCPSAILLEDRSRNTAENLRFSQAVMDRVRPGARCVIVTSNFHVLRTAILARRLGVRGQVTGAPTAAYYWPSAMLREFAAVFLGYRLVNFGICALIVALPLAWVALRAVV